jgi:hypothetical protein
VIARRVPKILLGVMGAVAVLAVAAYSLRDAIATALVARFLDEPGARCTRPDVRIDRSLKSAVVAPFRCSVAQGPIAAWSTQAPLHADLDGWSVRRIRVARATFDQRERDLSGVESNTLGDIADLFGFRDELLNGMIDASETFMAGGPVMHCDRMVMRRKGKVESVLIGFHRTFEDGWERTRATRMEGGSRLVQIRNYDMRVTPRRAKLRFDVHLGKPEPGDRPAMQILIEGRGLKEKRPYFEMSL